MIVDIRFDPHDVWIGAYWTRRRERLHIYICVIPTLVIHLSPPRRRNSRAKA